MRLLHTGPSIDTLHDQFAKKRRIDAGASVRASADVTIDAPIERVWAILSDVSGWPSVEPGIHDVALESGVTVDARFTWANGKTRIRSRFAVVDTCREITWTGQASGSRAVHRNVLEANADGTTRVTSEESMSGPLLPLFFNDAKLKAALETWLRAVRTAAEAR